MGDHFKNLLTGLKSIGMDLISIFTSVGKYSKYGSWGIKESLD